MQKTCDPKQTVLYYEDLEDRVCVCVCVCVRVCVRACVHAHMHACAYQAEKGRFKRYRVTAGLEGGQGPFIEDQSSLDAS